MRIITPKQCNKYINKYPSEKITFSAPGCYHLEFDTTLPLYTHDIEKVKEVINKITFPNIQKVKVNIYLPCYNTRLASNGLQSSSSSERGSIRGVFLFGRSTSIPYSFTEYTLPHEIGHAVQDIYMPDYGKDNKDKMWKEYCKRRGIIVKRNQPWHKHPKEIFADDFRILFSPYQRDFWPHEVKHPLKVKWLKKFILDNIKI